MRCVFVYNERDILHRFGTEPSRHGCDFSIAITLRRPSRNKSAMVSSDAYPASQREKPDDERWKENVFLRASRLNNSIDIFLCPKSSTSASRLKFYSTTKLDISHSSQCFGRRSLVCTPSVSPFSVCDGLEGITVSTKTLQNVSLPRYQESPTIPKLQTLFTVRSQVWALLY